ARPGRRAGGGVARLVPAASNAGATRRGGAQPRSCMRARGAWSSHPPPCLAGRARRGHLILATRWLIWLAWCAAPYPLSMLTTDTPGAHELSIARSAAMPPKDAPYPTLVGPALTGQSTGAPV